MVNGTSVLVKWNRGKVAVKMMKKTDDNDKADKMLNYVSIENIDLYKSKKFEPFFGAIILGN